VAPCQVGWVAVGWATAGWVVVVGVHPAAEAVRAAAGAVRAVKARRRRWW
jgi:hypothetical protein